MAVATGKNLHISENLLAQLEIAARAQGKTPDELGEEVIRESLDFAQLLAAGHAYSAERGFKPSDVMTKIAEYRRGKSDRDR